MQVALAVVAEDELSLALLERIVDSARANHLITHKLITRGIGNLRNRMANFYGASHAIPHLVLVDLDQSNCAAELRRDWKTDSDHPRLMFRVAVREAEAWLLADRDSFARFAGVPLTKIPLTPETEVDPKQTLINIVRRSSKRRLCKEIVPEPGSRVSKGPLYNERLCAYVREEWDAIAAAKAAPSLARTIDRLQRFPSGRQ